MRGHVGLWCAGLTALALVGCNGNEEPTESPTESGDTGGVDSATGDVAVGVDSGRDAGPDSTIPDATADVTPDAPPDVPADSPPGANACGGTVALSGKPGDTCGTCKGAVLRCSGPDALACDEVKNVCGGCAALSAKPGESCGTCGGVLKCKGTEELQCDGAVPKNVCLGCKTLTPDVGTPCGVCGSGKFDCSGPEATICKDPVSTPAPGTKCGTCGTLKYVCNADGITTACEKTDDVNACGGCGTLAGAPGGACGACGTYICSADKTSVTCSDPLPTVGEPCGDCGTSKFICVSPGVTRCQNTSDKNACGGCGVLPGAVGDACAKPVCGTLQCASTAMRCTGPTNPVGAACGICLKGLYTCASPGTTTCSIPDGRASGAVFDFGTRNVISALSASRSVSFTTMGGSLINPTVTIGGIVRAGTESGTVNVALYLGNPNALGANLGSGSAALNLPTGKPTLVTVSIPTTTPIAAGTQITLIITTSGFATATYLGEFAPTATTQGYTSWFFRTTWFPTLANLPYLSVKGTGCF